MAPDVGHDDPTLVSTTGSRIHRVSSLNNVTRPGGFAQIIAFVQKSADLFRKSVGIGVHGSSTHNLKYH
jgi:hypothetical protein